MTSPTATRHPRVFVSYSHDSPEHKDRVLALCDKLRSHGIDARLDQYETSPAQGWPRWCTTQVRDADFVLVACSEIYERRFRGVEESGRGLGVIWEGFVVTQDLYETGARNSKFVPILFPSARLEHVPDILRGVTRYEVGTDEGYWRLYRHLTGQPETSAPPLGPSLELPGRERKRESLLVIPEPLYEDERVKKLSEELEVAYRDLEEQAAYGEDVSNIRQRVLQIRREIRDGKRLQPGSFLAEGRFRLIDLLGKGGFATVWRAFDRKRHELVAVKVLHGQHTEDRSRRERFFRGARKMADLRHSGIVRVLREHLEDEGYHFFVMEYIKGGDLRRAILENRLPRLDILPLILSVGDALSFAHERGLIHRDVKPANILLGDDSSMLTDFDLVRAFDTTGGTQTQGMLGSFLYAAPEVLTNAKEAEVAADVYSLAMTTIFAYYGKDLPPDVWRHPEEFLRDLPCSPRIREVLLRGIAWRPEDRPRSIAELCSDLSKANFPSVHHRSANAREFESGDVRLNEKDGTVLIYVPGGEYSLGADNMSDREKPVHRIRLSAFWIGRYPVTVNQYAKFLENSPSAKRPANWNEQLEKSLHPVAGVSWQQAKDYCHWAGLFLPTEAQWEASARGEDRRQHPWGNEPPGSDLANFDGRQGQTTPVGLYGRGAGPFGTLDQAGNVWEWCEDIWDSEAYWRREGRLNPVILNGNPALRVLRGGSWFDPARVLAAPYRFWNWVTYRSNLIGFRCCLPATNKP